jgi:hypothetical protein
MLRSAIPLLLSATGLALGCASSRNTHSAREECIEAKGYCSSEACLDAGATPKVAGFSQRSICDVQAHDGGHACSSSSDCEGICYAALDARVGERASGQCSYSATYFFGCAPGGRVEHGVVVDEAMCYD